MTNEVNELCAAEIADHMMMRFGRSVKEVLPIDKGWLNVKWRMESDQGPLFVKYYHPERYKLHTHPERRSAIEKSLQLQHGLSEAGIKCPKVHLYNGHFIQESMSGLFYTVLDWVDGYTAQAGCLNVRQMFELGEATGRMHNWLRSIPPLGKPAWKPSVDTYLREWQGNWEIAQDAGDKTVMEWLTRSKAIVKSMDFRIFEPCSTGWLDFDRMTMAYPEIDIARAVLSGSLRNGQMQMDTARAFMEGYREHSELPRGVLTRAMSMLYLIESIWWLRTEVRKDSELRGLLGRFVEEMHWIEDNWLTLPDQLDIM